MGVSEWIAVVSVVTALISFAVQQFLSRGVNRSNARARHYERTHALLSKAIDDPELLTAIGGEATGNQRQRRYWQLWLNHIEMIYRQRRFFDRIHWQGTLHDVRSFMAIPALREHWDRHKQYYASDFQSFLDEEIAKGESKESEPETPTTPPQSPTT